MQKAKSFELKKENAVCSQAAVKQWNQISSKTWTTLLSDCLFPFIMSFAEAPTVNDWEVRSDESGIYVFQHKHRCDEKKKAEELKRSLEINTVKLKSLFFSMMEDYRCSPGDRPHSIMWWTGWSEGETLNKISETCWWGQESKKLFY